jgi:hypothetical protein
MAFGDAGTTHARSDATAAVAMSVWSPGRFDDGLNATALHWILKVESP